MEELGTVSIWARARTVVTDDKAEWTVGLWL